MAYSEHIWSKSVDLTLWKLGDGLKSQKVWMCGLFFWMLAKSFCVFSTTATLALSALFLSFCWWYDGTKRHDHFTSYPLPPGPRPWPVIGNLFQLGSVPFQAVTRLYRQYGPVFRLRLGFRDVVVVSGRAALRECFTKSAFQNRPDLSMRPLVAMGGSITFNDLTPGWTVHKKCTSRALIDFVRGGEVQRLAQPAVDALCQELINVGCSDARGAQVEGLVQPNECCKNAICRIMLVCCFGNQRQQDKICHRWQQTISNMQKLFPVLMAPEFFPWLRVVADGLVRILTPEQRELSQHMLYLAQKTSVARDRASVEKEEDLSQKSNHDVENSNSDKLGVYLRSEGKHHDRQVTLAELIAVEARALDAKKLSALNLSEEQLLLSVEDLMGAATDTTGSFLQWTILYLAKFPAIQDRLLGEIETDPASWASCAYVRAFNWELCRHSNLAAATLPHATSEDTTLCGYFIPRGTLVFGNLHSMYTDESVFPEPERFHPDRFLTADGEFRSDLLPYIPMFGLGRRRCLGEPLAKQLMQLFTARLVTNCRISEHPSHPLVLSSGIFNLIFSPHPYKVLIHPRQSNTC